ncbi:type IX secretion system sortase PorU [uncultured Prevotella sp.]|uniref:type IX secretion system sortase PorU n=1 Tax=uncultured Prevotella sp. TaxID=159272 RepID=UPI0025DB7C39|nr:type IX secretion system sortase PorU [uncultured Prevotella sp.]
MATLLLSVMAHAQHFFNLTADEVKIDSVLPCFSYQQALGPHYADSVYEVSIAYPEFMEMSKGDIARYQTITTEVPPSLPNVEQFVSVVRKEGVLNVSFVPVVFRDGKYQKLVSFMLDVKATAPGHSRNLSTLHPSPSSPRYAAHSVLAEGKWAKIRVGETGIYQLTDVLIRQAGFSNPSKVRIYGYGGALQDEQLTGDYLSSTDDLKEVPTCVVGGRRLFYAVGPVNWSSNTAMARTRNPYSDYGYYFLTEAEGEPQTVDSATFKASCYPLPNDYHDLYEVDNYAWYHGGRNLYEKEKLTIGSNRDVVLPAVHNTTVKVDVVLSFNSKFEATIALNGTSLGSMVPGSSAVDASGNLRDGLAFAALSTWTFDLPADALNHEGNNTFTLRQTSGGDVRIDYVSLRYESPKPFTDLTSSSLPEPEYVYGITNQDHHADAQADMVIIVPASQKFTDQAERLKSLHATYDNLRVNIVPADELYNEFSSGTPDATAYRRYMKMLYDRAESDADMPRYLLMFGDGAWDNRMLSSDWRSLSPEDFLLCYESENSYSQFYSYVTDDYFCLLDDDEGDVTRQGIDAAVGRLSARTANEAKIVVDKIYDYRTNAHAGAWQNTLCFMGDDGDNNLHMTDADTVATSVHNLYPDFDIKKIYWDAYTRVSTSTGNRFPEVEDLVRQQMQAGALVMNYSGHGSVYIMSHEQSVKKSYFSERMSLRLPLWVTASCDIMPFDGQQENFGELAMFNDYGGSIAFFGTTRTVYSRYNRLINKSFMRYVLSSPNGKRMSMGEAVRQAKNGFASSGIEMERINRMHYALLGDPALVLAAPTLQATVDSINGQLVSAQTGSSICQLKAGSVATVKGHIEGQPSFNGLVTFIVRDVEEKVSGKQNDASTTYAFTFKDRPNTIYTGRDSVKNGEFTIRFSVPQDISYSDKTGLFLVYAVSSDKTQEAHGRNENFTLSGSVEGVNDGIGPSIYCYLNSDRFNNGGTVNSTPYFYAELSDKDGINVAGSGIGHDLELIIDGDMNKTYNLNEYFQYNFGDYCSGNVGYSLPELTSGEHKLLFRAWDVQNNSSTAELTFMVDARQEPSLQSVICTKNPATTYTQFIVTHDRNGSSMDVELEIFDTSGRKLWGKTESGIPTDNTYTIDWDLTTSSGSRLRTGVYLYRVLISSNGSSQASEAKKLIVLGNN